MEAPNSIIITKESNGNVLVTPAGTPYTIQSNAIISKGVNSVRVKQTFFPSATIEFTVDAVEKVVSADGGSVNISDVDTLFDQLNNFFFFEAIGGGGVPVVSSSPYITSTMLMEGNNEFVIDASCIPKVSSSQTPTHGASIVWEILKNDSSHGSSFFTSLSAPSGAANLHVNYPRVKSVLNFHITNDESTQAKGVTIGGTVLLDFAQCKASMSLSSTGFRLTGNNTNWTAAGGLSSIYSLHSLTASGITTFANNSNTNWVDYFQVQITYTGENNYRVKRKWSGLGGNAVAFYLVDIDTNTVVNTPPTASDSVVVSNYGTYRASLNLANWALTQSFGTNEFLYNNNFWVSGRFELWMKVLSISSTENLAKWQDKSGVTTYNLYRDVNEDLSTKQLIYSGTLLEFKDTGLTTDTKYYYQLEDQTNTEITTFNIKTE